jgi:hypothetical protein
MIRAFSTAYGDNAPAYARLTLPEAFGSGQVHIPIGWMPSAVMVGFSRLFDEKAEALYREGEDEHDDPVTFTAYIDPYTNEYADPYTSTGVWIQYRNIPELDGEGNPLGLDINYTALH